MSAATAAVQATESKTVVLETNQGFQMDKLEGTRQVTSPRIQQPVSMCSLHSFSALIRVGVKRKSKLK